MKKTNVIAILFLMIFFNCACTSQLKNRDTSQFYSGMGLEKYFLSEIPSWANFSSQGRCFRTKSLQYLDIGALMKSFNLSYEDSLQIQATFNEEYLTLKKDLSLRLTFKDLEIIYFKASQKVSSKIKFFDTPDFKTVHLISVDDILSDKTQTRLNKLKKFLQSDVHNDGYPVLISSCMTKTEIEAIFPGQSLKILSAELFSSFNEEGEKVPGFNLSLSAFFKSHQKIKFYSQQESLPSNEILGNYKSVIY